MSFARLAQTAVPVANKAKLLIGQCIPSIKDNVSKIKVKRFELDVNLKMYFTSLEYYHAVDPGKKCTPGDIVLIEELPSKITKLITHKVIEIVHPMGDVTDPLTGKKVVVGRYREQIEKDMERFGKVDSAFDYESAPPRGWQKDKKDYSYRDAYRKYHIFPEEDPYAV